MPPKCRQNDSLCDFLYMKNVFTFSIKYYEYDNSHTHYLINNHALCVFHMCSDKDWREWSDRVQAPHQGKSLEMGPGQCQTSVQERQTGLHHRHPEASFVCSYVFTFSLIHAETLLTLPKTN